MRRRMHKLSKSYPLFDEPSFCEYGMFKPFEKNTTFVASCEQQNGVKIHPKLGRAILFFSISENPFRENPLKLHEGQIVKKVRSSSVRNG